MIPATGFTAIERMALQHLKMVADGSDPACASGYRTAQQVARGIGYPPGLVEGALLHLEASGLAESGNDASGRRLFRARKQVTAEDLAV